MVDRQLHDRATFTEQKRPEKSMAAVEHRQTQRDVSREDTYRTAGIADRLTEDLIANPVGPFADDSLRPDVPSSFPPTECRVVAGEGVPQPRRSAGSFCKSASSVATHSPLAAQKPAAVAADCPTFAASWSGRNSENSVARIPQHPRGLVGRTVIHQHDFVPSQPWLRHLGRPSRVAGPPRSPRPRWASPTLRSSRAQPRKALLAHLLCPAFDLPAPLGATHPGVSTTCPQPPCRVEAETSRSTLESPSRPRTAFSTASHARPSQTAAHARLYWTDPPIAASLPLRVSSIGRSAGGLENRTRNAQGCASEASPWTRTPRPCPSPRRPPRRCV